MKAERKLGYLAARATHHTVTFKEQMEGCPERSRQPSILSSWEVQSLWSLVSPESFLLIRKSYCYFPQNPSLKRAGMGFASWQQEELIPKSWWFGLTAFWPLLSWALPPPSPPAALCRCLWGLSHSSPPQLGNGFLLKSLCHHPAKPFLNPHFCRESSCESLK